jgi:transposase
MKMSQLQAYWLLIWVAKLKNSLVCKDRIVSLFRQGLSYRKIGTLLNLSFATVQCVIKKFKTTNSIENNKRSGRPRVSTRDSRNPVQQVSRNPKTSVRKLAEDLATATGKHVSLQRPFEIASMEVVTKDERQEKTPLLMN